MLISLLNQWKCKLSISISFHTEPLCWHKRATEKNYSVWNSEPLGNILLLLLGLASIHIYITHIMKLYPPWAQPKCTKIFNTYPTQKNLTLLFNIALLVGLGIYWFCFGTKHSGLLLRSCRWSFSESRDVLIMWHFGKRVLSFFGTIYLSLPPTRHDLTQGQKPEGRLKWG